MADHCIVEALVDVAGSLTWVSSQEQNITFKYTAVNGEYAVRAIVQSSDTRISDSYDLQNITYGSTLAPSFAAGSLAFTEVCLSDTICAKNQEIAIVNNTTGGVQGDPAIFG